MLEIMDQIQNIYISASKGDPFILGVIVAVVVVLVTIVLLVCFRGGSKKRAVLLMGLCDAGKTLIFSRLVYKKFMKTQTSIRDNTGNYFVSQGGSLRLIDLPGHERLRTAFLERYKSLARGIVFVVDSLTFQKDVKDVAEYLFTVLSDAEIHRSKPKVLIACNKSDATMAKGAKVIRSSLEREINLLRITQSAALDSTSSSSNGATSFLGKKGKDFEFSDVKGAKVEFIECSARGAKDFDAVNLGPLENWLDSVL